MARVVGKVCTAWVVANGRVSKFKGCLQNAFDWFLKQTMFARILKEFPDYSGKDLQMLTHTHHL